MHASMLLLTSPSERLGVSQSPVSKRALETIELLRSELERCHVDLETDEELFAEKVEELNELLMKYNLLLQEKERIEAMCSCWRAVLSIPSLSSPRIWGSICRFTQLSTEVGLLVLVCQLWCEWLVGGSPGQGYYG